MPLNFDEIMDTVAENVERPPLPPLGEYVFQIIQLPTMNDVESDKGSWKAVEFQVQGVRATESVDPDMLAAYGAPKNIRSRLSFMFDKNDDAAAKTTEFLMKTFLVEHLGLPPGGTLKELLNQSVNKQFIGTVSYRADKSDPNLQYIRVGKTAPVA